MDIVQLNFLQFERPGNNYNLTIVSEWKHKTRETYRIEPIFHGNVGWQQLMVKSFVVNGFLYSKLEPQSFNADLQKCLLIVKKKELTIVKKKSR